MTPNRGWSKKLTDHRSDTNTVLNNDLVKWCIDILTLCRQNKISVKKKNSCRHTICSVKGSHNEEESMSVQYSHCSVKEGHRAEDKKITN